MLNQNTYDTHLRLDIETKRQINEICKLTHFNPAAVISLAIDNCYSAYMDLSSSTDDMEREL